MAENTENKKVATSRERMLAKAQERWPERRFVPSGTESAQNAQGQEEAIDNLDDAIMEMLDEMSARQEAYDTENAKIRGLVASDPSSADFIQKWIETGDPRTALVEVFGDELGMSDEGREKFKEQFDSWKTRRDENSRLEQEAQANWDNSLQALEDWGNARGLTMEQKRDVMLRLLAITFNGMENKYTAEDFDLAFNAINHDVDVDAARREGEVQGRNAKIAASRRDRSLAGAMPPTVPGGQGSRVNEKMPKSSNSPWAGIK